MSSSSEPYEQRRRLNEHSRSWAKRDREPWTDDEDTFLLKEWIGVEAKHRDEITISQCLERTIEACRVRCEYLRKRYGIQVFEVTHRVETTTYRGVMDDPDECWWDPTSDYYK